MNKKKLWFLLPLRTIVFILIFLIISLVSKKDVSEISKYWTIIVLVCNFITIFVLYYICDKNKIKFSELIDYKKTKIRKIFFIGLLVTIIGIAGSYLSGLIFYQTIPYTPDIMFQPLPIIIIIIDLLFLPITSTIAEEGLYLGIGINKTNMLYSTVFFYLFQHCFFPMILDIKYIIYRFVAFIPAILFMCLYYKRKKDIAPIMFGHFIINFVTILQYFLV